MTVGSEYAVEPEYQPFPDEGGRNWRQEHLEIPAMVLSLGLPRGARVLEVGCGRGNGMGALARWLAPARLVGLDIDPDFLNRARERWDSMAQPPEFVLGDARALPFASNDFDIVLDFGTCFHIAGAKAALHEIARVLVPGGLVVTETRLSQLLSHPRRARGRTLPWKDVPHFSRPRSALLWESRRRIVV